MSKFDLLIASDPDFYIGSGEFKFPNGDKYEGDYCAHRSGIVWREGAGKYTTADGQVYSGEWKDDKLVEANLIEITYKDGVQFHGNIVKNKYEGPGMYIFDHKMALLGDFTNNKPIGELTLIDTKGREWHGVAGQDDTLLFPEHIYFNNISESSGKGKRRRSSAKQKKRQSEFSIGVRSLILPGKGKKSISQRSRSLLIPLTSKLTEPSSPPPPSKFPESSVTKDEATIFAKTKKTRSDLQLENSDWYKNYTDFKEAYDKIKVKIEKSGEKSFSEEEKRWYNKYMDFKQRYWDIMNSRKFKDKNISREEFFEVLRRKEFEDKCPPMQVIYATEDCASVCDCEVVNEEDNASFKT